MKLRTDRTGWATPIVAVLAWAATIGGVLIFRAEIGHWDGRATAASVILFLFCGPIALLTTILAIWGTSFVELDPIAGTARYVNLSRERWRCSLAELGPLAITEKSQSGLRARRFSWFELRKGDDVLFTSSSRERVEQAQALIQRLIDQSAVRRILATATSSGDGAFREAPDVVGQATQAVREPARLRAVLEVLAQDLDDEIRVRATELKNALERT